MGNGSVMFKGKERQVVNMGSVPYKDAERLQRLYWEAGMTLREMCDELGCSKPTLIKYMDKFDIERRDCGGNDPDAPWKDEDNLRELYCEKGRNTYQIAEQYDIEESTVRWWMDRFGIERGGVGRRATTPELRVDARGYEVFSSGQDKLKHHRLLAVAEYGFDAVTNREVHHTNNIPWDNRVQNLRLMTKRQHSRHHANQRNFGEKHGRGSES